MTAMTTVVKVFKFGPKNGNLGWHNVKLLRSLGYSTSIKAVSFANEE